MINERFKDYFRENFFKGKDEEFQAFLNAIEKSIPRTIRIKPGKVEEVKKRLEKDGWILDPTAISNVFSLDRREDFDPLERRIGYSLDHLVGNFYIQELAAAHPVDILANGEIQKDEFLILDMASSPGGKTTQLAEYFPNSFIIANEPTRERIPQLLQNLDRMGSTNIGVTLYAGQYWRSFSETFDRILLDAPCSGEGTLYKGTDAVKHWHIKNIKTIAKLQEKLLDAGLHALKVGGEMIYSTCSLNLLEDEGVVEAMKAKYPNTFEVIFEKKFWPHIDNTGGFYVAKIRKLVSLPSDTGGEKVHNANKELKKYNKELGNWDTVKGIGLYEHEKKLLALRNSHLVEELREKVYFMRFGEYIGQNEAGVFTPSAFSSRNLAKLNLPKYVLEDENELDMYLRGYDIPCESQEGYVGIEYDSIQISLEHMSGGLIKNTFPLDWRRK